MTTSCRPQTSPARSRFLPVCLLPLALCLARAEALAQAQPTSLSITPSQLAQGKCYEMDAGNGANMTLDVQYRFNNGPVQTIVGWPELDAGGEAEICTGSATAPGAYRFTAIRNTLNTAWVAVDDTVTVLAADFALSISPSSRDLGRGQSATFTISVDESGAFSSSVSLSVSGLGSGLTASFSPNTISVSQTSTLTISAPAETALGAESFTVRGAGGGLSDSQSASVTIVEPQPTSLGFSASQGYAGVDCYTMTLGNGANMSVDFKRRVNDGAAEIITLAMNSSGKWSYCLDHWAFPAAYTFTEMKNSLNSAWVVLSPARTYTVLPPQPTSLAITPSMVTAGEGTFTAEAGNSAGISMDVRYTRNGGPLQTDPGWGMSPLSPGSPDGRIDLNAGLCTLPGNYQFTGVRNSLNSAWVAVSQSMTVHPPPAPSVASVTPSSGAQGASVAVEFSGENLCNVSLSTTWPGLTFSNVSTSNQTGTSASATFNISPASPAGVATVTLASHGGVRDFSFIVSPGAALPAVTGISPASAPRGTSPLISISGTNLTGASLSTTWTGLTFSNLSVNASGTLLTATFNISPAAPAGTPSILVSTPNGSAGTPLFTITAAPAVTAEYIYVGGRLLAIVRLQ